MGQAIKSGKIAHKRIRYYYYYYYHDDDDDDDDDDGDDSVSFYSLTLCRTYLHTSTTGC